MRIRLVLAALAVAAFVSASRADSVTAQFENVTNGGLLLNVSASWLGTVEGYVGQYNWVTQTSSSLGPAGTSFYTFCIEINQDIGFGGVYNYQLIDPSGAPKPGNPVPGASGMGAQSAALLDVLWDAHIGDVTNAGSVNNELLNAAAFQLAVWNIVYDTRDHSANAVTTSNSSVNSLAATWLTNLDPNGPRADLIALSSDDSSAGKNDGAQDQITAVPLPASAWAGLALLGGLGMIRFGRSQLAFCRA